MANIQIAGRLTRDAEVRFTPNGKAVASFSIAENVYQNGKEEAQFFNCQIWGERGEKLAQYLTKGAPVTVFGTLTIRKYTDKQGFERQSSDVNVNDLVLQGNGNSGANSNHTPPPPPSQRPAGTPTKPVDDLDDDIPF